jgi:riboflavin biosynthesis pyrimidine reductase
VEGPRVKEFPPIRQLLPTERRLAGPVELEQAYEHPRPDHLRVNFISSLDGAVEIDGRSGPLGGPADRAAFMALRALADVVMVGAGTARAENYGPVKIDAEAQKRRLERGQAPRPPLAVVTARAALDPAARLFAEEGEVLIITTQRSADQRPELAAGAELLPCGESMVELRRAVEALRSRGLRRILCEGGPELMRSLLSAGLVDELCLTISPLMAGPQRRQLSGDAPPPAPERFRLAALLEGDGMLLARYEGPDRL